MRETATGEAPILWVCDRCFKYMRDGSLLELHSVCGMHELSSETTDKMHFQKSCHASHPPGRKVYQRGAHVIWEVDGSKDKV